ncbi:MAG: HlyC/CorC family transporter [Candidatus Kerfeldbacteria bacterium]|nr:HlyC/CorC family transporter [Candidatus Kerfeldbacteria bacterium]
MTPFIVLVLFLLLSAYTAAAEAALLAVSRIKVRSFVNQKRWGSIALQRLKARPRRMIITTLLGNNIANTGAAALATLLSSSYFGSLGVGIATGILTVLILIFGDIIPKSFAARHAGYFALRLAPSVMWIGRILFPFVRFFEWVTGFVDRLVLESQHDRMTVEDIQSMIQFGVEEKVIAQHEHYIINRVLTFSDNTVRDVMIPIEKVFTLPAHTPIDSCLPKIIQSGYSRVPLYQGERNHIIGLVLVKDVVKESVLDWPHERLLDIALPPMMVPEQMTVDFLFRIFQKQHRHMAVVFGKHQEAVGIVTLEDLIEELVGEIEDEGDDI